MEIGIDIERNNRFEGKSASFLKRIFTPEEIEYAEKFKNSAEQYCSFWCVKEATVKAFSNLKMPFSEICTLHDKNGKPYIKHNETIKKELKKQNKTEIKISVSNSKDYSVAICIIS